MVLARVGFFEPGSGSCAGALVCANVIERTSHHRLVAGRHVRGERMSLHLAEQDPEGVGDSTTCGRNQWVRQDGPTDPRVVDLQLSELGTRAHGVRFGLVRDENEESGLVDSDDVNPGVDELVCLGALSRPVPERDESRDEFTLELDQSHARNLELSFHMPPHNSSMRGGYCQIVKIWPKISIKTIKARELGAHGLMGAAAVSWVLASLVVASQY